MKKILYIHGFGSDKNSYTSHTLKQLFPQYDWYSETFDLLQVKQTNQRIRELIDVEGIDTVVSSSLGGIYALFIKKNEKTGKMVNKIFINPCCYPSRELPHLSEIPMDILCNCRAVEYNVYKVHTDNTPDHIFGIFSKNDELLQYHDFFVGRYGNGGNGRITASNCIWVEGGHAHLDKEVLLDAFSQAFNYFDEINQQQSTAIKPILCVNMDRTLVNWESGKSKLTDIEKLQYDGAIDEVPGIFSWLVPKEYAVEAFSLLSLKFDIYVYSTSTRCDDTLLPEKLYWLQKYFGDSLGYKCFVLSHGEELNKSDIMIKRSENKNSSICIHFGTDPYTDWRAVVKILMNE